MGEVLAAWQTFVEARRRAQPEELEAFAEAVPEAVYKAAYPRVPKWYLRFDSASKEDLVTNMVLAKQQWKGGSECTATQGMKKLAKDATAGARELVSYERLQKGLGKKLASFVVSLHAHQVTGAVLDAGDAGKEMYTCMSAYRRMPPKEVRGGHPKPMVAASICKTASTFPLLLSQQGLNSSKTRSLQLRTGADCRSPGTLYLALVRDFTATESRWAFYVGKAANGLIARWQQHLTAVANALRGMRNGQFVAGPTPLEHLMALIWVKEGSYRNSVSVMCLGGFCESIPAGKRGRHLDFLEDAFTAAAQEYFTDWRCVNTKGKGVGWRACRKPVAAAVRAYGVNQTQKNSDAVLAAAKAEMEVAWAEDEEAREKAEAAGEEKKTEEAEGAGAVAVQEAKAAEEEAKALKEQ